MILLFYYYGKFTGRNCGNRSGNAARKFFNKKTTVYTDSKIYRLFDFGRGNTAFILYPPLRMDRLPCLVALVLNQHNFIGNLEFHV